MRRYDHEKRLMAERVLRELAVESELEPEGYVCGLMRLVQHTDDVKAKLIILRRLTRELTAAETLRSRALAGWAVHRVAPGTKVLPDVGVVPDRLQRVG